MSRMPYEIHISAQLDPDEHPEEGRAWNLLGDRIEQLLQEARRDPAYKALHYFLDPTLALERMDRAHVDAEEAPGADAVSDDGARVRVTALLNVGDETELVTPDHDHRSPLRVPASRIADDAGLPAGEIPGRRFTAVRDGDTFRDFRLVDDPRL